jgi:putative hydrolase of the HAD superfamily
MAKVSPGIPTHFSTFRLFIFDLDGTLYNQKKLRRKLSFYLLLRLIFCRIQRIDINIIKAFRAERERHKGYFAENIGEEQYQWCAEKLHIPALKVKQTIEEYMYRFPLRFLPSLKYKGIDEVFHTLKLKGKQIVIYSDLPVEDKMKALKLTADQYFCSTDKEIEQLKPGTKALFHICETMKCGLSEAIMIGDRDDTDGEAARLAGMKYLIVEPEEAKSGTFYASLLSHI